MQPPPRTFSDFIIAPMSPPAAGIEPLAALAYGAECALKEKALRRFWSTHGLAGELQPLVPSPRPRHYRTTSKRKIIRARSGPLLAFTDGSVHGACLSRLEPEEHGALFRLAQRLLARPVFAPAAASLNYLVVRGTYREFFLIFNAHSLDRIVVGKLRDLADGLRAGGGEIHAAFIYHDPSRSPYYLELERPSGRAPLKKLFGPDCFRLSAGGRFFRVPVLAFSQVNESILERLLAAAADLLAAGGTPAVSNSACAARLIDLYCGYGLFSCSLGSGYRQVIGIEAGEAAIAAARENGRALLPAGTRALFRRLMISHGNLASTLPRRGGPVQETIILDPPRNGVDDITIRALASRRPQHLLHVFCSVDEIPRALAAWRSGGYQPRRIVPLDMFPGTCGLEVLIALERNVGMAKKSASVRMKTFGGKRSRPASRRAAR